MCNNSIGSELGPVVGCCECDIEPQVYIIYQEYVYELATVSFSRSAYSIKLIYVDCTHKLLIVILNCRVVFKLCVWNKCDDRKQTYSTVVLSSGGFLRRQTRTRLRSHTSPCTMQYVTSLRPCKRKLITLQHLK